MHDDIFLRSKYTTERSKILAPYIDSQVKYLKQKYPDIDEKVLRKEVTSIAKDKMKVPQIVVNDYTDNGNVTEKTVSLSVFMNKWLSDNIFSPSGTIYIRSDKQESFLKTTIQDMMAIRKKAKADMFKAVDNDTKMYYDVIQSIVKIVMNSIIGAMKNKGSVIWDDDGFNAITAACRHFVKYGYSHVEKLLGGNLYFAELDDVYHHITQLIETIPSNINELVNKYNLYQPTHEDIFIWLCDNYSKYKNINEKNRSNLLSYIKTLKNDQLAYVYYSTNIKHLLFKNDVLFRSLLSDMYTKNTNVTPEDLKDFNFKDYDEVFINALKPLFIDEIGKVSDTNVMYTLNESEEIQPDKLNIFKYTCSKINKTYNDLSDLFSTFFVMDTDIINIHNQDRLTRDITILSDTDSVIVSLMELVRWYTGDVTFSNKGLQLNSFMVYIVTKTLEHVFARQSKLFGCDDKDISLINMKNEFLYPVLMTTPIKKTYAGLIHTREGNVLPKLQLDIKGVAFKSSNLNGDLVKNTGKFIQKQLETAMDTGHINVSNILTEVSSKELSVINSTENNTLSSYVGIQSIKPKEQYKDPEKSIYRIYEFYNTVFAHKYGTIAIPSKVYVIPIKNGGKYILTKEYLEWLKSYDESVYDRLIDHLKKDKRLITRMIFPMSMGIPKEMSEAICIRTLSYMSCKPMYLFLEGLGLTYPYRNQTKTKTLLVSDYWS